MSTNEDINQPAMWELVSPSVVANVPMTYPASEIDGTMVASIMSPEIDERYTHPPALADEIKRIPDYEIALKWHEYVGQQDTLVEDISSLVEARRELMGRLLDEEWTLFFYTFMEPDRLQHLVWDESLLREHYKQIDAILGDILDYTAEHDVNLFVVSDHGFGSVSKSIGANRLLEENGYLTRRTESTQNVIGRLGINKANIEQLFDQLGIEYQDILKKYAPREVIDFLGSTVPGSHFLYDLDHEKTMAFVHEFGSIYVNDSERFADGPVAPDDVGRIKRELTDLFSTLRDPDTGERVLTVHDGDELFNTDPRSPDLVLEAEPGYLVSNSLQSDRFDTPSGNASHRPEGIFLAWGPDIDAGVSPDEMTVVDVAPTVLHALGAAVPANVDGTVLQDIFREGSAPDERQVALANYEGSDTSEKSDKDMGEVKDRLQGLGYLE